MRAGPWETSRRSNRRPSDTSAPSNSRPWGTPAGDYRPPTASPAAVDRIVAGADVTSFGVGSTDDAALPAGGDSISRHPTDPSPAASSAGPPWAPGAALTSTMTDT